MLRRLPIKAAYNAPDGKTLKKGIILDTETTGLDHKSDCVNEFAMILFEFDPDTGRVYRIIETFGALEGPGIPISAESSAVHGITDEMVHGKKLMMRKLSELLRMSNSSLHIIHVLIDR